MKNLKKWLFKKAALFSLSLSNVEKNALGQSGEQLNNEVTQNKRHTQGQLADSLINGEITQEVVDLRWRTYKVLQQTQGLRSEIVGYDEENMPIVKTIKIDKTNRLKKIKTEPSDVAPLEIVVDNNLITNSVNDIINNKYIDISESPSLNKDKLGEITGATHGYISADDFYATFKPEKPIKVQRDFVPKFNIENYTDKLHVRIINDNERLLEFYISKYPNQDNKTSSIFLNALKKIIENPSDSSLLQIKKVDFVSYNTIGVDDFLRFEYDIVSFDKIVEFNGFYVLKFKSLVTKNGESIVEEYRQKELDKKYENKEKK